MTMAETNEVVDLLASLGRALGGDFVQIQPGVGPVDDALGWSAAVGIPTPGRRQELVRRSQVLWGQSQLVANPTRATSFAYHRWQVAVTGVYGPALEDDVLIVARRGTKEFAAGEYETILAFSRLIPVAMQHAGIGSPLDDLVTHLATQLMSVSVSTLSDALANVVRILAEFFSVSTAFLRRNDHELGASVLVAEWPIRVDIPDPDPLGVVPFEGSDPVFAAVRDLREPMVIRPDEEDEYQERVKEGAGLPPVAMATVPILRDEITSGVLGFINFGDREWSKAELNALRAIASLLAQLEGRIEAEARLQQGAYRDELTGLPNRRALREILTQRLEGSGASVAVAFADLDGLKALNDSLGHAIGDALLRGVAERVQDQLRTGDMVARLGGDEFVVVLRDDEPDPLDTARGIIAAATAEPLALAMGSVPLTMSAGVAVAKAGTLDADELLHRADVALIEAKAAGPKTVLHFDEEMLATSEKRSDINRYLHSAVSDNALELYYLPEIDLTTGALVAVEALVRWHHPNLGLLLPGSFIALAEQSPSLISEMGEWVLHEACSQLAKWRQRYHKGHFVVRVNVSPVQLMVSDMVSTVRSALEASGLEGADVCLELTERAVLREMDQVVAALKELRKLGVTVALDDFGTGYSTLTQLRWLPVDTIKIDMQFITDLGTNASDLAIVESTINLSKTFNLDVVAEGLETVIAARELVRMGCHRAEGHLIHAAAPAKALRPILERGGVRLPDIGLTASPT
jgi:diguanylate cyclase (GGDEF)-like protein